ncbi:hypothetical protein VQ574_21730 (plasmid) [Stutzerimonas frequens]|uniref:hypothetical protein n=1 Tax=Stutzerimonas frequens TaxID=2968969 RepID=UPI002DBD16FD|nr:hypothetical protein [Stutzerimonas frequens]WRW29349.1 hypothetical protein VQ574_21730 [Stutzerimonas frequens]
MAGTDSSKLPTRSIPSGIGDEMIEIDTYQEIHWPQNQNLVGERFPLNPILRNWFDQTPNTERESLELSHWWDLPFIVTDTWEDQEAHHRNHQARLRAEGYAKALSEEQVEAELADRRANWFNNWPTGTRYEIRCLDGGAWDRSTHWGMVSTLEEAVAKCAAGPVWRRSLDAMSEEVRAAAGLMLKPRNTGGNVVE